METRMTRNLASNPSTKQLLAACERGDVAKIQHHLDNGVPVDAPLDDDGNTCLAVATANAHDAAVQLLLKRGAALETANVHGWTPAMQAARHGRTSVLSTLLNNKADPRADSRLGASLLLCGVCSADAATVKTLLESGSDATTRWRGPSPLALAAYFGYEDIVRLLLDHGADADRALDATRLTPLILAAINGRAATVTILVDQGANPNLQDALGNTALDHASTRGHEQIEAFLRDRTSLLRTRGPALRIKTDTIVEAARQGDAARIRELLREDPRHADACSPQDGATPLMFAAMMGRLDVVETLVTAGARLDSRDKVSGWTALMQATFHGHKDIVKYLISHGADAEVRAKNGATALTLATTIDEADTEMIRIIASNVAAGAPKAATSEARSRNGTTRGVVARAWRTSGGEDTDGAGAETASREGGGGGGDTGKTNGSLRLWWNRMSNRFRNRKNLKLGRTFRLSPMPLDPSTNDDCNSPSFSTAPSSIFSVTNGSSKSFVAEIAKDPPTPKRLLSTSSKATTESRSSNSAHFPGSSLRSLSSGYESLLLDSSVKGRPAPGAGTDPSVLDDPTSTGRPKRVVAADVLKPVVPPFHVPPGFEPETSDGPTSPITPTETTTSFADFPAFRSDVAGGRVISGTATSPMPPGRTSRPSAKLFAPSPKNLGNRHPSPSASSVLSHSGGAGTPSPHSSGGASSVSALLRPPGAAQSSKLSGAHNSSLLMSSGDSSTLTAGSDGASRAGSNTLGSSPGLKSGAGSRGLSFLPSARPASASSISTSRLAPPSALSSRRSARSNESRDSGTLTPTPSARETNVTAEKRRSEPATNGVVEDEDLSTVLSRLSLERYQPVFEEQEVDIEAFLTLTDDDLRELGIAASARGQFLEAIERLNESHKR